MALPPPALLLYDVASAEAHSAQNPAIDTPHLVLAAAKLTDFPLDDLFTRSTPEKIVALFKNDQKCLANAFERAQVDPKAFRRRLRFELHHRGVQGSSEEVMPDDGILHRTKNAKRVFERALEHAGEDDVPLAVHVLQSVAATPDAFWLHIWAEFSPREPLEALFGDTTEADTDENTSPHQRPRTPTLDRFGRDLTALAREGKLAPVWGRDAEIVRLAQILASARKGNALLIGAAGVGKTAVVEGLATRLVGEHLPPGLENLRLVEVPLSGLLAGASYRGQWEERLQELLKEASAPQILLFLDEIHTLIGAGGQGVSDAAQILKPALARGEIRVIGATTGDEYARTIERDAALQRRFETMWIEEPTREAALAILRGARPKLEAHHGATFSDAALEAAIELSIRLLPDLRLPDKALDALDGAASAARFHTLSYSPATAQAVAQAVTIGREEVAAAIARRARVPLENALLGDAQRLLGLEAALKERVVGQDEAIARVSDALKLSFSGFKAPGKPHATFLFAGASGSGKTELAKALACALYGNERALHGFDMSEYSERHNVARLLGAPPGYIGHDEDGALSKPLRERPASVLLFDEIEKAHPDVWNLWLQIFDEGHITDARGRRLDFSETVIVMTSNLGAGVAKPRALGFRAHEKQGHKKQDEDRSARKEFERAVLTTIKGTLKPELLGRISEILVFPPLDERAQHQITIKALETIGARARERGVELEWSDDLLSLLAHSGFDAQTGARPLAREVERRVALPLADALLRGEVQSGAHVRVVVQNSEIAFEAL